MEIGDFKIGQIIYTETGAWEIIDIGFRTVCAYKIDEKVFGNWDEQNNHIFYPYDFEGIYIKPFED